MSDAERWAARAEEMGLMTGVDSRNLIHVVTDRWGWRSCRQPGDGHGDATGPIDDETRVCMWCREMPGRERHAREVLGVDGPSWEVA